MENTKVIDMPTEVVDAAEEQDETSTGVYVHKFKKPFTYEGKTYEELTFDFEGMTGRDAAAIENELRAKGHTVLVAAFDGEYLVRMCAKACTEKIGFDTIEAMSIRDYNKIRNAARGFLLR